MRQLPPLALFLVTLLAASGVSAARFESYEDRNDKPPDIYDPDVTGEIDNLQSHLYNDVSCGGWINADAQEEMEKGVVTEVFGAPGRDAEDSFGNIASGLGVRANFTYPGQAYGYQSACSIYDTRYNPDQLCMIGPGNATPFECRELYFHLLDLQSIPPNTIICGSTTLPYVIFTEQRCFDHTSPCTGPECECGKSTIVRDYGTAVGNVIVVDRGSTYEEEKLQPGVNDECRPKFLQYNPSCYYLIDGDGNYVLVLDQPLTYQIDIASFYRHYGPIDDHDTIPEEAPTKGFSIWSEGQEQRVSADCYEYYVYKDAKEKIARTWNRRCEIYETDDSDVDVDSPEWQADAIPQKTEIEPNDALSPYTPEETDPDRLEREIVAPWVGDDETSIALLTGSVATSDDITSYLHMSYPLALRASRTRNFARTDPFDDATDTDQASWYPATDDLEHRTFSRWWQEQQQSLVDMLRVPSVRLLLPARYGVGLSRDDPLLQYATKVASRSDGKVEVELRAGKDVMEGAIASLRESYLLVPKEVRVPVIVPVVSEAELNALIHDWRQWEIEYDRIGDADEIVARLESYREQVRNVRLLRGAVADYLSDVLAAQASIRAFFAQWYLANAERIEDRAGDELRASVVAKWRELGEEMLRLSDRCSLKWCSDARYTLPIYSLLDPWMPERPELNALLTEDSYTLTSIEWTQAPDIVADFSSLKLPSSEFYLPSLEVTQIRIDLPLPPGGEAPVPNVADFPDIPMIDPARLVPDSTLFAAYTPPEVETPELGDAHYVPAWSQPAPYEDILARLTTIQAILTRAADNYCSFYNSVEGREDQGRKIVHTEFDLRERIARLFARRLPLWKQDYAGRETRLLGSPVPRCEDDTLCQKLYPEETTSFEWQVNAPDGGAESLTPAYDELRQLLLPASEEANPYIVPLQTLMRYLFPDLTGDAPSRPPLEIRLEAEPEAEDASASSTSS